MDELNGGKTSLKEEKSHNDKTLKQTSCKSERKQTAKVYSTNKVPEIILIDRIFHLFDRGNALILYLQVVIESVTPDGLPPGWLKEIKIQKKANGTRKDTVWISSSILRSFNSVFCLFPFFLFTHIHTKCSV